MKRYVLDSYSLIAYAEGEKGAGDVAGIFRIRTLEGEIKINWI